MFGCWGDEEACAGRRCARLRSPAPGLRGSHALLTPLHNPVQVYVAKWNETLVAGAFSTGVLTLAKPA